MVVLPAMLEETEVAVAAFRRLVQLEPREVVRVYSKPAQRTQTRWPNFDLHAEPNHTSTSRYTNRQVIDKVPGSTRATVLPIFLFIFTFQSTVA